MTKIENIEDVAKRLKGLREALEMSAEEVANVCGIDCDTYRAYENCEADIPVSFVRTLAHKFGVELPAILFGEEPKMSSYFVTRCGNGVSVERSKAYSYQALAAGFSNKVINPYMVTVEPSEQPRGNYNTHDGQEFNYVVEGRMEIQIAGNTFTLETGDSIIFNSSLPHRMRALDGRLVRFLAIIS